MKLRLHAIAAFAFVSAFSALVAAPPPTTPATPAAPGTPAAAPLTPGPVPPTPGKESTAPPPAAANDAPAPVATTTATPTTPATPGAAVVAPPPPRVSTLLGLGAAKGTFSKRFDRNLLTFVRRKKGQPPVTISNATAFVDKQDDRKPTILILSDAKLSAGGWHSEADLRKAKAAFTGLLIWIDKAGKVFRTDQIWDGHEESVSGLYEVKLESQEEGSTELSGTVTTLDTSGKFKFDATFHTAVK